MQPVSFHPESSQPGLLSSETALDQIGHAQTEATYMGPNLGRAIHIESIHDSSVQVGSFHTGAAQNGTCLHAQTPQQYFDTAQDSTIYPSISDTTTTIPLSDTCTTVPDHITCRAALLGMIHQAFEDHNTEKQYLGFGEDTHLAFDRAETIAEKHMQRHLKPVRMEGFDIIPSYKVMDKKTNRAAISNEAHDLVRELLIIQKRHQIGTYANIFYKVGMR